MRRIRVSVFDCLTCGNPSLTSKVAVADGPEEYERFSDIVVDLLHLKTPVERELIDSICKKCRKQLLLIRAFMEKARFSYESLMRDLGRQRHLSNGTSKGIVFPSMDKEVQVDIDVTHPHFPTSSVYHDQSSETTIDESFVRIKLEPEDYELDYVEEPPVEPEVTSQIKIEPLSEKEAKFFHQQFEQDVVSEYTDYESIHSDFLCDDESSDYEIDVLDDNFTEEEEKLLNGIMSKDVSSDSSDSEECFDHSDEGRFCFLCDRRFKTRKKLKMHVILEHSHNETLRCNVCDMAMVDSYKMIFHERNHITYKANHFCHICNKSFDTAKLFYHHLKGHNLILITFKNTEIISCRECNTAYDKVHLFFDHLTNVCKKKTQSNATLTPGYAIQDPTNVASIN